MSYEDDVYYPAKPEKLAYGHSMIWGLVKSNALGYPSGDIFWGIQTHSLTAISGTGRWVFTYAEYKALYTGHIYITGLAIENWKIYLSFRGPGLMSFDINSTGYIVKSSRMLIDDGGYINDVKIYQDEIYTLWGGDGWQGIKVFDLDLNLIRQFTISSLINENSKTMAVQTGKIHISNFASTDVFVYSTGGDYIKKISLNAGVKINEIN